MSTSTSKGADVGKISEEEAGEMKQAGEGGGEGSMVKMLRETSRGYSCLRQAIHSLARMESCRNAARHWASLFDGSAVEEIFQKTFVVF
jgi:hypothetical protein